MSKFGMWKQSARRMARRVAEAPYWFFRRRRELRILRKTRQWAAISHAEIKRLTEERDQLRSLLQLRELEVKQLMQINERNNQRIAWEIANFARHQAECLFRENSSRGPSGLQ